VGGRTKLLGYMSVRSRAQHNSQGKKSRKDTVWGGGSGAKNKQHTSGVHRDDFVLFLYLLGSSRH
jgi:hypothetical protein